MVYESDFYTSRRPYSRPTVTSYSVTDHGVMLPGIGKGQTFHHNIPSIGHKRLVLVSPGPHNVRSRPSVLMGEMDRIYHRVRPSLAYQPTEDYLNSRSMVSFDDETRSIRAKTADILRRIHSPVPRAQRPLPLPGEADVMELPADWYDSFDWYPEELGQTRLRLKLLSLKKDLAELNTGAYYSHSELPITERITSDNYIDRLLSGTRNVARDINVMSHYEEPAKHYTIGRGHLACVSYAGGRPIAKRRNLATDDYIKDDINVLSHYGRFRAAAAASAQPPSEPEYSPPLHRPPTKSAVTGSWKSNAPRVPKEPKSANLTAADEFDASQERKQRRREAVEAAAQREVDEEKRRKQEHSRQDDLAQQALVDREEDLARKAREEEQKAEEDRLTAERLAKEEEERQLREEEEKLAAEEQKLIEEEEARKRQEEEEKKAKKAKKETEKKAREEAERKAKEEEEERRRIEEEERKAKEEAEQKAKEEEERLRKEEEERKAKEEEEQKAKEEAERLAAEEAERLAKEESDRQAAEEAAKAAEEASKAAEEVSEEVAVDASEAVSEPKEETDEVPSEVVAEADQTAEPSDEPVVEEPAETPAADDAEEVLSDEAEEE